MGFGLTRRDVLIGAASASAVLANSAASRAQANSPLAFQLSWIKSIQYGGYFAALDQGYYKANGIEPTFNPGGPNMDAVANVAAGQSQIGDRPVGALVIARDKGVPIKIVGTAFQKSPYCVMSLASKPLNSVKDFVGKTIALPTSSRPLMLYLLRSAGVSPADVNIVPSSPDPAALVTGQLDGYAGYSTNQGVMLQTRGVEIHVLNVQDLGMPEIVGTLYAREDFLKANRDRVVRFLRASSQGWKWALNNPEKTAHLMVEKYGAPGLDFNAQFAEIKASKPYIEAGVGGTKGLLALDLAVVQKILDIYKAVDIIKRPISVDEFCDASYVDEALSG